MILGLALVVSCALALPAEEAAEVETAPLKWTRVMVSDGEALYAELCAVCHGAGAKGDGPAAPALAATVPDLTMLALSYDGVFPLEEVEKAISREKGMLAHGTLEMPIWGRILEDSRPEYKTARREAFANLRIHNLAVYLETLQVPAN
jgi:mono/diheme cytochrome c family protein